MPDLPSPTNPARPVDRELDRWTRAFAGDELFYGEEPGPVARRAVRYHAPWLRPGESAALDAGCGEGQDLAFLARRGYRATGVEFTAPGAEKARRFLARQGAGGVVVHEDLRTFLSRPAEPFDLVLAVNSLQFLGPDASSALDSVADKVAAGGVLGLSLFGREEGRPEVVGTVWFTTLEEILERFAGWQCMEAARLWQWDTRTNRPQPFVTLVARKTPPAGGVVPLG